MAETPDERDLQDIGAILDRALEASPPKGRRQTKTQQLREQRHKVVALRDKGYTLSEIAAMVGVSKDTLRAAIREPETGEDQTAKQSVSRTNGSVSKNRLVKPVGRRKQKFPANDDL